MHPLYFAKKIDYYGFAITIIYLPKMWYNSFDRPENHCKFNIVENAKYYNGRNIKCSMHYLNDKFGIIKLRIYYADSGNIYSCYLNSKNRLAMVKSDKNPEQINLKMFYIHFNWKGIRIIKIDGKDYIFIVILNKAFGKTILKLDLD